MGSISDWDVMSDAAATLAQFGVEFEKRVVSAHRTPELLVEYAKTAKSRGLEVIIAGAGGAAHLPGGYVYLPYDRRKHLFQRTAGLNHNEKTAPHRLFEPVRGRSI